MAEYDYLILGGGIAGLSTAWHLARGGAERILLVERERVLGSRASAENAAILRSHSSDPAIRAVATESAEFLRSPGPDFGPFALVDGRGLLLLASGSTGLELEAALPIEELRSARIDRATRTARAPHLRTTSQTCLSFPGDGRIDVAAELAGFERGARAKGVEIRTGAEAAELDLADGGRRVRGVRLADGTRIEARRTILAAGGWAGKLAASAGSAVQLRPTRRHLLVTAADANVDENWPVVWIEDEGFYCRPESGGLLISACDTSDADPDRYSTDDAALEWIAEKVERFLPTFQDAGAAHLWCGLRTLTPDDRFAIGFDPHLEGLFWVAGLGGHGMTCGPGIGRLASVALLDPNATSQDTQLLEAMAPARLTSMSDRDEAAHRGGRRPPTHSVGA